MTAVASRDRARAEAYARERSIPRVHDSYDALVADPELDAVYVPLPHGLHVDWSVRALEAGKHVLCEKPLTRHPEEAERAFDVAERQGLVLAEAFMYRHLLKTARVRELVAGGAIGRLRSIHVAFTFQLDRADPTRLARDLDGGALMDVGCYCVSGARLLAGEPLAAAGVQDVTEDGVDRTFHGTLRFPGEVTAHLRASFELPWSQRLEAVGEEGTLEVETPFRADGTGALLLRRGGETERIELEPANAFRLELENFADAVEGRAEPLLGRADAVGQARALDALYRAAAGAREVEVAQTGTAPGA